MPSSNAFNGSHVDKRIKHIVERYARKHKPAINRARLEDQMRCTLTPRNHLLIKGYNPGVTGVLYTKCIGVKQGDGIKKHCRANPMKLLSFQFPAADMDEILHQVHEIQQQDETSGQQDEGGVQRGQQNDINDLKLHFDVIRFEYDAERYKSITKKLESLEQKIGRLTVLRKSQTECRVERRVILKAAEAEYCMRPAEIPEEQNQLLRDQYIGAFRDYARLTASLKYTTQDELIARNAYYDTLKNCRRLGLSRPALAPFQVFEDESLCPKAKTASATPKKDSSASTPSSSRSQRSNYVDPFNVPRKRARKTLGTIILSDSEPDTPEVIMREDGDGNIVPDENEVVFDRKGKGVARPSPTRSLNDYF